MLMLWLQLKTDGWQSSATVANVGGVLAKLAAQQNQATTTIVEYMEWWSMVDCATTAALMDEGGDLAARWSVAGTRQQQVRTTVVIDDGETQSDCVR